jgi:hypothetical protein
MGLHWDAHHYNYYHGCYRRMGEFMSVGCRRPDFDDRLST